MHKETCDVYVWDKREGVIIREKREIQIEDVDSGSFVLSFYRLYLTFQPCINPSFSSISQTTQVRFLKKRSKVPFTSSYPKSSSSYSPPKGRKQ